MPMVPLSFGYDDLYLISASLNETLEGCVRREQDARTAGDTYKAAFEAQRSRKYRRRTVKNFSLRERGLSPGSSNGLSRRIGPTTRRENGYNT